MSFDGLIADIERNGWPVHGAALYQGGRLCARWGDTQGRYPLYSITKSILSLGVGAAWDRGRIDLARSVLDYLPASVTGGLSAAQQAAFAPLTLHRLMTMSVPGFPFRPEGESYLRFSLACPLPDPAAPAFHYSNIPACLVGIALTEALGEDAWAWMSRRILAPLHIEGAACGRCPEGYFYGASGMQLSVEELSRVGLLLGQGGVWEERQLVSADYIRRAGSALQPNREGGYGYFFWARPDGFYMSGKWGQRCYILPGRDIVFTVLSHMEANSDPLTESVERNLLDE